MDHYASLQISEEGGASNLKCECKSLLFLMQGTSEVDKAKFAQEGIFFVLKLFAWWVFFNEKVENRKN